jgi:hypothetical protein
MLLLAQQLHQTAKGLLFVVLFSIQNDQEDVWQELPCLFHRFGQMQVSLQCKFCQIKQVE